MQFHILDENNTPVAVMDNDLPDAIHFQKSKLHQFLTGSANFFDFETSKLHADHQLLQVGYWIAFKYDGRDRLLYINDIQEAERDKMMSISSLSDNLDLNNETIQPFSTSEAKTFKWYFDKIMFDTGYEIGLNEISDLTRKLSWDSEMTIRNFIQSVATQFDNAELDYEVQLNSDFTVKKRLIHIKKKIGEVRDDIELRYGDNIKTVKRTTDISGLCTAVRPLSKDNNDKVVDISSLPDWQELDDNGNIKFYHKKGSNLILAPQANARFGNRGHNVTGGGFIVHDFSHDNVSQSEIFNRSLSYLKEHSVPAINYEVEGRTGAKIGDTVKIVNDGYSPQLLLSARVLEQVISFDDATVEQATFGNYKALQSQISSDLIAKMQQLADENAPYKAVTLTTNGLTFKNSEGSTLLTARLYKGTKEIVPESYDWIIDSVSISGSGEQREITADDIDGKAVVRWSAIINGEVVAFDEVTIIDVSDGIDGSSGKDAWSINMTNENVTLPAESDGVVTSYDNSNASISVSYGSGTQLTPVMKGDQLLPNQFKVINPEYNLLTSTKDFSGNFTSNWWDGGAHYYDDGYYNEFKVKSSTYQWYGLFQEYTITEPGTYSFSAFVKSDYDDNEIYRFVTVNDIIIDGPIIGHKFDWTRDSVVIPDLSVGDIVYVRYEKGSYNNNPFSVAGHKLEHGSIPTIWMPDISNSEITIGSQTIDTISKNINYSNVSNMIPVSGATCNVYYIIYICNQDGAITTVSKIQKFTKAEKGLTGDTGNTGQTGEKGDPTGVTKSATEPENKFVGMIWYVDSDTDVPSANMEVGLVAQSHGQYTWNGTKWSLYMLRSINMMMDNGFIDNAMIADATIESAKISSVDAVKVITDSLSTISADLGDITAGTYISWSIEDYEVYDYLSAIYLFNGGIRFLTIENPNTTDPETAGVASGKLIRGMSVISGMMQFYQQSVPSGDTRTANEILKEIDGFWTPYGDTGGYCGSISSYKYSDGTGQISVDADLINLYGEVTTNVGTITNISSISVALFYGITIVFRRQGNLVIASIARQVRTTSTTGEDILTNEKVPSGYRPSYSHYFGINRNSGTNILKDLVMGIASNGDVRVTIGETGAAVFTGSTSYFTADPLPLP